MAWVELFLRFLRPLSHFRLVDKWRECHGRSRFSRFCISGRPRFLSNWGWSRFKWRNHIYRLTKKLPSASSVLWFRTNVSMLQFFRHLHHKLRCRTNRQEMKTSWLSWCSIMWHAFEDGLFRHLIKSSFRSCSLYESSHRSGFATYSSANCDELLFDCRENLVMMSSVSATHSAVAKMRSE